MATLYEIKENINKLEIERQNLADYITEKAADPNVTVAELNEKKAKAEEYSDRIAMLRKAHDDMEEAQKSAFAVQGKGSLDEKERRIKAKAAFYRAAITGVGDLKKAYEGLGGIPKADSDLGSGDKLLPHNMSNTLLMEPKETNPLRAICRITNITGYEEPKLGYTIEDADLADVTDKQTANEIKLEGDTVSYGRKKAKISATLKDTVMYGTDLDVVTAVEGALREAIGKREKHFAFLDATACASDATHAEMSFYNEEDGASVIKTVTGATMYDAIVAALADLADDYSENARVVMRKSDYYTMIKELANDSESLFGEKPASIIGYPVVFCDKATTPVVGDFSFYGINYDIGAVFETDKDGKKGEYYFILTAWGDQKIRLKSAFRLAKVQAAAAEGGAGGNGGEGGGAGA